MRIPFRWWRAAQAAAPPTEAFLRHRGLIKGLLVTATGAGLAHATQELVEASYTNGSLPAGPDVINTNLTVQGNLVTQASTTGAGPGYVGVGVTSPAGPLDVAGAIYVNGAQVIDGSGIATRTYYAP